MRQNNNWRRHSHQKICKPNIKLFGAFKGKAIVFWSWISGRLGRSRASCRSGCFLSTHRAPLHAPAPASLTWAHCAPFICAASCAAAKSPLSFNMVWSATFSCFGLYFLFSYSLRENLALSPYRIECLFEVEHIFVNLECLWKTRGLGLKKQVQMSTQSNKELACFMDKMVHILSALYCLFKT